MKIIKLMLVSFFSFLSFDMHTAPAEGQVVEGPGHVASTQLGRPPVDILMGAPVKQVQVKSAFKKTSSVTASHQGDISLDKNISVIPQKKQALFIDDNDDVNSSLMKHDLISKTEKGNLDQAQLNKNLNVQNVKPIQSEIDLAPSKANTKKSARINTDANQEFVIPNRSDNRVSSLLDSYGVSDINAPVKDGNTALHLAARNGDTRAVNDLISVGADVNAANDLGFTPLHEASYAGRVDTANLLIQNNADIDAQTNQGNTSLHEAKNRDITQLLLDKGANVNIKNGKGESPDLHKTIGDRFNDLTSWLTSLPKSMVDIFNKAISGIKSFFSSSSKEQQQAVSENLSSIEKTLQIKEKTYQESVGQITDNIALRQAERDNDVNVTLEVHVQNAIDDYAQLSKLQSKVTTSEDAKKSDEVEDLLLSDLVDAFVASKSLNNVEVSGKIDKILDSFGVKNTVNRLANEKIDQAEQAKNKPSLPSTPAPSASPVDFDMSSVNESVPVVQTKHLFFRDQNQDDVTDKGDNYIENAKTATLSDGRVIQIPSSPKGPAPRPMGPPSAGSHMASRLSDNDQAKMNGYKSPDQIIKDSADLKLQLDQAQQKSQLDKVLTKARQFEINENVTPRAQQEEEHIDSLIEKNPAVFNENNQDPDFINVMNKYNKAMSDTSLLSNPKEYETALIDIVNDMNAIVKKGQTQTVVQSTEGVVQASAPLKFGDPGFKPAPPALALVKPDDNMTDVQLSPTSITTVLQENQPKLSSILSTEIQAGAQLKSVQPITKSVSVLDQVKKGATLKQTAGPVKSVPVKNPLLEQIQSGKALKKVDGPVEKPVVTSSLESAMDARRKYIQPKDNNEASETAADSEWLY